MINRLKKYFGKAKAEPKPKDDGKDFQEWNEEKSRMMEEILGAEHNMVMHAIFPYAIGGGLDLYYFPNGLPGIGIATKELSELPNQGSSNREFSCYELVMFTRHGLNLDEAKDEATAFGKAHSNIQSILNRIAPYSATAKLNGHETCEFPADMEVVGGKCLVFISYGSRKSETVKCFGLLAIMEIFRSEMDYARANGSAQLIGKLKTAGYYPYSDMDREPVV